MKKAEFMRLHGLSLRPATSRDRKQAKTDYQRNADYIISSKSGVEWFSKNGSMADMKEFVRHNKVKKPRFRL